MRDARRYDERPKKTSVGYLVNLKSDCADDTVVGPGVRAG